MLKKAYIYGRGQGFSCLKKCIKGDVQILGFIDNYSKDTLTDDGIPVIRQSEICGEYDYIVVSIIEYEEIKAGLIKAGIDSKRIICFFDPEDSENDEYNEVIDQFRWKFELMWKNDREIVWPAINNNSYEIYSEEFEKKGIIPKIIDARTTIDMIIKSRFSLVRFGDGEFEIIRKRDRPKFQSVDPLLSERLEEVLKSQEPGILVAIANNYGNLSEYTDHAANGIRYYMTPQTREAHMSLLDMNRGYYDAYLSRPYMIYRDKTPDRMHEKFEQIKCIWKDRDILIVEGEHTRFGVGNDLLDEANSVIRILAPDRDAFSLYDQLLEKSSEYGEDRLVLSILGPTATVLCYDLAKQGLWAVDIGQVDTEYEWFIRGVSKRCDIPYKTASEYVDKSIFEELQEADRKKYEAEIVSIIK
ncbi:MAG: GT-D fold domain-containing protein [Lachnospiraceae bacterium]|nr:GT-D fold domain-containing protein [Lachnospiraceae bacterium]